VSGVTHPSDAENDANKRENEKHPKRNSSPSFVFHFVYRETRKQAQPPDNPQYEIYG
jgi:hypothetical protein